ncbi:MAG: ABC transporter ATP-binding protein [Bdellovibrionales bacterium]|nr:ABC transporter ATP-binding protein [Bdellovibrionales bacterium]
MIEVKELSKKFGDFWALKNTSWKVEEKRALGLLGPNGAGKSTTMKIMTGLLCSTEGQVLIDGEDVFKYPIEAKRKIGFLPETPPVYEDLNVWSYLDFICGLKSVPRKQRKSQIEDAIDKMSLSEVAHKYIGSLSKGFRQRVGIAQSLIGSPAILILDEPSVGLDPHQVYELRNIIKDLKSDHTIVLSTHVLSEVQQICDDVVIIDKGEIKTQGSLDLIISQMQGGVFLEMKVNALNDSLLGDLKSHLNVSELKVSGNNIQIHLKEEVEAFDDFVQMAIKNNCGLISMQKHQTQLEDVFIEVTKG